MKLKPVANRILIKLNPADSKSRIHIPDNIAYESGLRTWNVLDVGPDVKTCQPGDNVLVLPSANLLGIDPEEETAIADASVVIALSYE